MYKVVKVGVSILPILVLGCTDLSAVSQFAASGAKATSSTDVFSGYPDAEKASVRLAFPPTDHPTKDQLDRREDAQKNLKTAQQLGPVDVAGLKALALYFSVLTSLSSDKLIDVKSPADSISKSLGESPFNLVPTAKVSAVSGLLQLLIQAPLDAYRNEEVGKLITQANPNIMTICTDLSTAASAIAVIWESDTQLSEAYYAGIPGPANDVRSAVLMRSLGSQEEAVFNANQAKAKAMASALNSVCDGQKQLFANSNNLKLDTLKGLLNGYSANIQVALQVLSK